MCHRSSPRNGKKTKQTNKQTKQNVYTAGTRPHNQWVQVRIQTQCTLTLNISVFHTLAVAFQAGDGQKGVTCVMASMFFERCRLAGRKKCCPRWRLCRFKLSCVSQPWEDPVSWMIFYFVFIMVDLQCFANFCSTAKRPSHTHIDILFLILSSIMFYPKWLDRVPWAVQRDLLAYPF